MFNSEVFFSDAAAVNGWSN